MSSSETAALMAREAIRDLVQEYCWIVDSLNYEDLARVMSADAILTIAGGPTYKGLEQIVPALREGARLRNAGAPGTTQQHHITTSQITLADDGTATGRHYLLVTSEVGLDQTGMYEDVYRKSEGSWRIVQRHATPLWVVPGSRFVSRAD